MKTTNLLIIGGSVVLVGLYLSNKNKKTKAGVGVQALKDAQSQTPALNTNQLLSSKEATVYATKTIADVNTLLVKYPALKKDEFIKQYNNSHGTNLFLVNSGNINEPKPTSTGITSRIEALLQAGSRVYDADRLFKVNQRSYTQWKSDFGTVYSNLKDYFSTLNKEQADVTIKYLPKMIIQNLLGDNDPRVRLNDFYSQEEMIEMIDNKLNTESIISKSLGGFFGNLRVLNGFSNVKKSVASPIQQS
jgi:hypothetical protein